MSTARNFLTRQGGVGAWRILPQLVGLAILTACSPASLVDTNTPSTVVDPSLVQTANGAAGLRVSAIQYVLGAVAGGGPADVVGMSGMITDELQDWYLSAGYSGDDRHTLDGSKPINLSGYGYDAIQRARVTARAARQALQQYAANSPNVPRAWQGEMYALEGYTVVWLAELYCSGVPLSQSSLTGVQVATRGLTTQELFSAAAALFDSAMVAGADSAQFVNLARVGKARALLGLGQFDVADSVAAPVPIDFVYTVPSPLSGGQTFGVPGAVSQAGYRVMDREGGNGLVWSTDPRTGVVTVPSQAGAMLWPAKYNINSSGVPAPLTPVNGLAFRLSDGLEARLIQAEAALKRGDASWLTTLNMLRATCVGTAPCAPRRGLVAASFPPLSDPTTPDARLDTLMKERAMWLYFTGHREGDLRRMAHLYGRAINTLWPTGTISDPAYPPMSFDPGPENGKPYGSDVVYAPDVKEHALNPLYGGCFDINP